MSTRANIDINMFLTFFFICRRVHGQEEKGMVAGELAKQLHHRFREKEVQPEDTQAKPNEIRTNGVIERNGTRYASRTEGDGGISASFSVNGSLFTQRCASAASGSQCAATAGWLRSDSTSSATG